MSKKKSKIKQVVRTPMFRMRVEVDKTKYKRKRKHKDEYHLKSILASIFKMIIIRF